MGAGGLADHVELALQRVLHDHIVATSDEDLAQDGFLGAHRGRHGHVAVHRHIAPAQQHLAFGLDGALHLLLAGQARGMLLGQEDHAHAVFPGRRQHHALLGHFLAVQSWSGIWIRIPAPSPISLSAPTAPRWSMFSRILSACVTMSWRLTPLMCATKPRPQASCSLGGRIQTVLLSDVQSRRPWSWRTPHIYTRGAQA
jgi:hypothetical protein